LTTEAAEPAVLELSKPALPPPRLRRFIASMIDAGLLCVVGVLWCHWVQWAQYTDTFARRWPAVVAMPVVMIFPVTALWLEAISSRGLGKWLTGLRVVRADGDEPSLRRLLFRSAVKWSPVLIGPIALLIGQLSSSNFADTFASDRLVPWTSELADILPTPAKPLGWMLEQAARTLNVGAVALTVLALGEIQAWIGKGNGLIDILCGTRVIRSRRITAAKRRQTIAQGVSPG
jgi:uncharacterized RDD family membrane protein YckC